MSKTAEAPNPYIKERVYFLDSRPYTDNALDVGQRTIFQKLINFIIEARNTFRHTTIVVSTEPVMMTEEQLSKVLLP